MSDQAFWDLVFIEAFKWATFAVAPTKPFEVVPSYALDEKVATSRGMADEALRHRLASAADRERSMEPREGDEK